MSRDVCRATWCGAVGVNSTGYCSSSCENNHKIAMEDTVSDKVMHGWYSELANLISGCSFYLNDKGEKIPITLITESATEHHSGWKDIQYVGVVVKHAGVSAERLRDDKIWDDLFDDSLQDSYDDDSQYDY